MVYREMPVSGSWWKTGAPVKHQQPVARPTGGQIARQLIVIVAVVVVWGGLLVLWVQATGLPNLASLVIPHGTPGPLPSSETATQAPAPTAPASTQSANATAEVSFSRDVLPIFERVCVKCHGGETTHRSLVLKSYADVMAGSENGYVITPGDPANSTLIDMITSGRMPKSGPRLLPSQVRLITQWVKEGAQNN